MAAQLLQERFEHLGNTLSFASFGTEIDTSPLNAALKKRGCLQIMPYRAEALANVRIDNLECILVPGLGFDRDRYRIGYGQGFYDRFLAQVGPIPTIGIGFHEQLCDLLPKDPWDLPVGELALF